MTKSVELPVDELKRLGEKLQQSIVLTRIRAGAQKSSRIKARAERVVRSTDELYRHVSDIVATSTRLTGFMQKALGITVDDIFGMTGHERAARGAAYTGMALVIRSVESAIDELARVNKDMEEVKNG